MKIKVLCIAIIFHLWTNEVLADDFNYSFIRGGSKEVPEVLKNTGQNVPGNYVVDLLFNGSKTATSVELTISKDDAEHICLSDEWLQGKGIYLNKEFYKQYLNPARNCYLIDKEKNSLVKFDPSLQELSINMPQAGFVDIKKRRRSLGLWQYRFQTRL
ncbi:FimD/PapC N-terminal domain-containing protein [Citrobacter amalonaticus]|nr:FimD/PapC N-terminal domain-containing protein [Citrobacter amalonaticus]